MAGNTVEYITASAVAKMMDPEMPVALKMVTGPSSYDSEEGFSVSIEELSDAPLFKVLDPIIGNDGSVIVATDVQRTENNVLNMHFAKLVADSGSGQVYTEELDAESDVLNGVNIYVLAFGGVTQAQVIPPEPGLPPEE